MKWDLRPDYATELTSYVYKYLMQTESPNAIVQSLVALAHQTGVSVNNHEAINAFNAFVIHYLIGSDKRVLPETFHEPAVIARYIIRVLRRKTDIT